MSLLQDVLRTQTLDSLDKALAATHVGVEDDSEDELVNVVCMLNRRNSSAVTNATTEEEEKDMSEELSHAAKPKTPIEREEKSTTGQHRGQTLVPGTGSTSLNVELPACVFRAIVPVRPVIPGTE